MKMYKLQTIVLLPSQIINRFAQKIVLNYKSLYNINETLNVIYYFQFFNLSFLYH